MTVSTYTTTRCQSSEEHIVEEQTYLHVIYGEKCTHRTVVLRCPVSFSLTEELKMLYVQMLYRGKHSHLFDVCMTVHH